MSFFLVASPMVFAADPAPQKVVDPVVLISGDAVIWSLDDLTEGRPEILDSGTLWLTISGPADSVLRKVFEPDELWILDAEEELRRDGSALPDGRYRWRLEATFMSPEAQGSSWAAAGVLWRSDGVWQDPSSVIEQDSTEALESFPYVVMTDLHVVDGADPTLRLEQDETLGRAPVSWDFVGNETGLSVSSSGHPTPPLQIDTAGRVGIGKTPEDIPGVALDVGGGLAVRTGLKLLDGDNPVGGSWDFSLSSNGLALEAAGADNRFLFAPNGDLIVDGTLRAGAIDADAILFDEIGIGGYSLSEIGGGILNLSHESNPKPNLRITGDFRPRLEIYNQSVDKLWRFDVNQGGSFAFVDATRGAIPFAIDGETGVVVVPSLKVGDGNPWRWVFQLSPGGMLEAYSNGEMQSRRMLAIDPQTGDMFLPGLVRSSGLFLMGSTQRWPFLINESGALEIYSNDPALGVSTKVVDIQPQTGDMTLTGTLTAKIGGENLTFPDYVFEDDYSLLPLDDLAIYIEQEGHLPRIPKAAEVENAGINMTELQLQLLEKVEELTLYTLQQHETIGAQRAELDRQAELIRRLEQRLAGLEGFLP